MAQPRRCGGNAPLSSASAVGMIIAAPAPWTARAAIRTVIPGESAHAADAAANTASPAANTRRLPILSPSAAAVISSTAKLSVYAFTVHSRSASEEPSFRWMAVSAVATTSMSRITRNDATDGRARAQRCAAANRFCSVMSVETRRGTKTGRATATISGVMTCHNSHDRPGAGARHGGRQDRLRRAGRAVPWRAAPALLPDARLGPGRGGRAAGDAGRGVARPWHVRGPLVVPGLAVPDRHQQEPQRDARGQVTAGRDTGRALAAR